MNRRYILLSAPKIRFFKSCTAGAREHKNRFIVQKGGNTLYQKRKFPFTIFLINRTLFTFFMLEVCMAELPRSIQCAKENIAGYF